MSTNHTKSNSIILLKQLIANRRRYVFKNTTQSMISISHTNLSSSKQYTYLIIISCLSVCFLMVLFFLTIILRQYFHKSYRRFSRKQHRSSTLVSCSPIVVSRLSTSAEILAEQLHDVYLERHAFDDLAFSIEFQTLPNYEDLSCLSAIRPTIISKNRFVNILPLDQTRVILNELNNDPTTDYINGNYISGYKCPKKFIATQGPKLDTCEDFWRMIWELNLQSIVMLTNVIENGLRTTKCHQYWPDFSQTIVYGSYQIICIDEQNLSSYKKRVFQLNQINNDNDISPSSSLTTDETSSLTSLNGQQDLRLIVQYHFTQWQDMDVPNDCARLIQLIHDVNQQTNIRQYPIVVHCTAGVGRTGTYIAIDAMIDKFEQERKIDIFEFVSQMRRERHFMVQTVKQYVYIYRTILEYYLFGNTRIEGRLFSLIYSNLKPNLQLEFNKLSLLPQENVSHHDALLPENRTKNRNQQIIPYDHNRVCLSRIHGHSYINASFIEGTPFIITQDPSEDTITEFWRMFIEHNTNCIVQLHTRNNDLIYYPTEDNPCRKITPTSLVKFLSKEVFQEKFIVRQFSLLDTRETLTKTIYHYEYLPIVTNDINFSNYLFDFIGQINKKQTSLITIHNENGGSICAIFGLLMILLDQLKTEHTVDIFQTVRQFRYQRPDLINSFIQYEYFYEMLSKFLDESYDLTTRKSSLSLNNSIYDND